MARRIRRSRPLFVQFLTACIGLVLLTGLYLGLMRAVLPVSRISQDHTASDRDMAYLGLHAGLVVLAALGGFGLGKWLNGLGAAYATLFIVVLVVAMVLAQLGSFALACNGHNDLIRHWTC